MDGLFDLTPVTDFVSQLDPLTLLVLAALYIAAQIANPILDLSLKIWRFVAWATLSTWQWLRSLSQRPEPPSLPPPPTPPIPPEETIWELRAPLRPVFPKENGIPIITVAAMKGGVGKTTIAANLAFHFQRTRSKPVLLIDFDYQGSLSEMVRGEARFTDRDMTAHVLILPPAPGPNPIDFARQMPRPLENVFLYPADYPLATIENNLMIGWVQNSNDDLMYRLCNLLRGTEFQEKFGAIIIDSPPRLTTGSINALCASTHVLIPTTLDDMSAQAAVYFLSQIERMKERVFPSLKVIGVVPSIIALDGGFQLQEQRSLDTLKEVGLTRWKRSDFVLEDGRIPRLAQIARSAGLSLACLHGPRARQVFERLGKAVDDRL